MINDSKTLPASILPHRREGAGTEYNVLNKVVIMARLRRLSNSVFELGRQLEVDFLHHRAKVWLKRRKNCLFKRKET